MKPRNICLFSLIAVSISLSLAACRKAPLDLPDPEELRAERFGKHGDYLRQSDRLEIYSIASTGPSRHPPEPPGEEEFQGFKIYGMTQTGDKNEIESIWLELHERIDSGHGSSHTFCFWPRHAIRAFHGDEHRDYLIYFECDHLYVYVERDGKDYERIGLEHSAGTLRLNDLLDRAKVPREQPETKSE